MMIDYSVRNLRTLSRLGPSGAIGSAAEIITENDPAVVFLTADLCSFSGLERFFNQYPNKLINVGIAEQNMLGIASGLSKEGFIPFATTYASFACSRCADQVRVNMAYMRLPIKLVGLTSGFAAGILGATHMCIEDVAFMRALPNITILSPADCIEIVNCFNAAVSIDGPVYIRLTGPMNMPIVYHEEYSFSVGKSVVLREGIDIAIIATGSMVSHALEASELLAKQGITCTVVNMHTIKPLDTDILDQLSGKYQLIVTVEEHNVIGGLGSAVSEYLIKKDTHTKVLILGVQDFFPNAGDYEFLLKQCELNYECIYQKIMSHLTNN